MTTLTDTLHGFVRIYSTLHKRRQRNGDIRHLRRDVIDATTVNEDGIAELVVVEHKEARSGKDCFLFVDDGGLTQEFMRLVLKGLRDSHLFEGTESCKMLAANIAGKYLY